MTVTDYDEYQGRYAKGDLVTYHSIASGAIKARVHSVRFATVTLSVTGKAYGYPRGTKFEVPIRTPFLEKRG